MRTSLLCATLLAAALFLMPAALALPEDRDQPIEIQADQVELDDETGVATYQGNVRLDQGSLRVTAHRLTIHTRDQEVDRIVAEGEEQGEPARYRQIPEAGAAPIEAHARRITYRAESQQVELAGRAHLRQQDDTFAGDRITYDIRERRITATGSGDGEPVTMTIQPGRSRDRRPQDDDAAADES